MPIERIESAALSSEGGAAIIALCNLAYDEELSPYLDWIGPGVHLLCHEGDRLVGHAMIVERALQPGTEAALRTGYVELVATHPEWQGCGIATALLRACEAECEHFELAALSPSSVAFYERLGWQLWQGPLSVRTGQGTLPTPDEAVMIRRTGRTPAWLDLTAPLSVEWREGEIW
jgi:aminoglycoside 2'-N-acetyltransferase I